MRHRWVRWTAAILLHLRVEIQVAPELKDAPVPSLIVQPLVETRFVTASHAALRTGLSVTRDRILGLHAFGASRFSVRSRTGGGRR